jgi:putative ABC transport system permease protein
VVFFTYAYRSLLARRRASLVTLLSVALFVAGATLGLTYYLNLASRLVAAPPEQIIVVAKGAASESESKLKLENARKLLVLEGIKHEGDQVLAVRELVSYVFLSTIDFSRYEEPTAIRGFDDKSAAIHDIKLVEGAMPAPGTLEVMVGRGLAKRYPHLRVGYEIGLPGGAGKVTGIFSAKGSVHDDEVWTPRAALELHLNTKLASSVTLIAESGRVADLLQRINSSKDLDAQATTMSEFRADRGGLHAVARTVLILLVLLSIVATFAIARTMNASVLTRVPELGALAAIGVPKGTLSRVVVVEGLLLAVLGAALGLGGGLLIASLLGRMPVGAYPVELHLTPVVLLVGIGLGLAVGLVGGVLPSLQVRRLDILTALR